MKTPTPNTVYFYPYMECNLRCRKCYVDFSDKSYTANQVSVQASKELIDQLDDLGVLSLILLGGEPLMYDGIFEVLEYASKHPFLTSLSTNGVLVTEETADRLGHLIDRVQVSQDGGTRRTSEFIKDSDTYSHTIQGIEHLLDAGLHVTVGYVMTSANTQADELEAFLENMVDLGVQAVSFMQYYPKGLQEHRDLMIGPNQWPVVRRRLQDLEDRFSSEISLEWEDNFAFDNGSIDEEDIVFAIDRYLAGCRCGKTEISIYSNGDVYPCDFLMDEPRFCAGNIHEQTIREIWYESPVLKEFRGIDVDHSDACGGCEFRPLCNGGCRALSWIFHGRLDEFDPRCPHYDDNPFWTE